MGKLAPAYLDNVLTWKLKTLIQGAIERQKLECNPKSEDTEPSDPTITYDRFVEALSVRDSFTATIMELLVKEVADRQTRILPHETSFIGANTRRTLHQLSIHADRSARRNPSSRPAMPVSNSLGHLEEDSVEFQNMVDNHNVEGAQIDSSLYDAFSSPEHIWHAPVSSSVFIPSRDESPPFLPPPRSPTVSRMGMGTSSWAVPHSTVFMTSSGPSLARQPSIRRPNRPSTQAHHFRDFTSRRRSSSRLVNEADEDRRSPSSEDLPRSSVRRHPVGSPRRLFSPEFLVEAALHPPSLPTPSASSPSSSSPGGLEDESEPSAPPRHRLRRGGLRAPEALLSRHASPSIHPISPTETLPVSQRLQ